MALRNAFEAVSTEATLAAVLAELSAATLTERMLAKVPTDGTYRLWFDTGDPAYIYTAEAVAGSDPASAAVWDGIRVTLNAAGNPVGAVQVATGFAWDARTTAGWT